MWLGDWGRGMRVQGCRRQVLPVIVLRYVSNKVADDNHWCDLSLSRLCIAPLREAVNVCFGFFRVDVDAKHKRKRKIVLAAQTEASV